MLTVWSDTYGMYATVQGLGAAMVPPGFDEMMAHTQKVLPLRFDDERPEGRWVGTVEKAGKEGLGYGGVVGVGYVGGRDAPRAARL